MMIDACCLVLPTLLVEPLVEQGSHLGFRLGCALVFASEAKIKIEPQILFRLEAKKA
jgi:hypothetical protein